MMYKLKALLVGFSACLLLATSHLYLRWESRSLLSIQSNTMLLLGFLLQILDAKVRLCNTFKTHIFITPDIIMTKSVLIAEDCLGCLSLIFAGISRGRHDLKVIFKLSEQIAQLTLSLILYLGNSIVGVIDLIWASLWCHRQYRFGT